MRTYFCESDHDLIDIRACIQDNILEFWRRDRFGRAWYRRTRTINAVAAAVNEFFPASAMNAGELERALEQGLISEWNTDPVTGEKWYRLMRSAGGSVRSPGVMREIHGVPRSDDEGNDDGDDE